jgi:hypothetical protein
LPQFRAQAEVRTERILCQIPAVDDRLRVGGLVLEVGCGVGVQVESLPDRFRQLSSSESTLSPPVLEVARDVIVAVERAIASLSG